MSLTRLAIWVERTDGVDRCRTDEHPSDCTPPLRPTSVRTPDIRAGGGGISAEGQGWGTAASIRTSAARRACTAASMVLNGLWLVTARYLTLWLTVLVIAALIAAVLWAPSARIDS